MPDVVRLIDQPDDPARQAAVLAAAQAAAQELTGWLHAIEDANTRAMHKRTTGLSREAAAQTDAEMQALDGSSPDELRE